MEGAAGSVKTLAPIRAIDVPVALSSLSTLEDLLPPNSLRLSRIDWKNDEAAAVNLDDEGFDDVDELRRSSTRLTEADLIDRSMVAEAVFVESPDELRILLLEDAALPPFAFLAEESADDCVFCVE